MSDTEPRAPARPNHFHGKPSKSIRPFPDGPRSLKELQAWLRRGLIAYVPFALIETITRLYMLVASTEHHSASKYFSVGASLSWSAPSGLDWAILPAQLIYTYCVIVSCRWIYRAMRNLYTVESGVVTITPRMAYVWFFIPVMNLFMPLRAMREILTGTQLYNHTETDTAPNLRMWWIPFILSIFLGHTTINAFSFSATAAMEVLAVPLSIFAAIQFISLTGCISHRQASMSSNFQASPGA